MESVVEQTKNEIDAMKMDLKSAGKEIQNVSPVLVRSYAWVYEWPKQEE